MMGEQPHKVKVRKSCVLWEIKGRIGNKGGKLNA